MTYTVANGVLCSDSATIAYREIDSIRVYARRWRGAPEMVCEIGGRGRRSIRISSLVLAGTSIEDRIEQFLPFTDELLRCYRAADPEARVVVGRTSGPRWMALLLLTTVVMAGGIFLVRDWIGAMALRHVGAGLVWSTVRTLLWSAPAAAALRWLWRTRERAIEPGPTVDWLMRL